MIDNDIDNLSRAAFPKGDVAFDAKYWDQMGAMIDQRKKKRGFIFWWGVGASAVLITLATGVYLFAPKADNLNNKKTAAMISELSATKPSLTKPKLEKAAIELNNENETVTPNSNGKTVERTDAPKFEVIESYNNPSANTEVAPLPNEIEEKKAKPTVAVAVPIESLVDLEPEQVNSENITEPEIAYNTENIESSFTSEEDDKSNVMRPESQNFIAVEENSTNKNAIASIIPLSAIIPFESNSDKLSLMEVADEPDDYETEFGSPVKDEIKLKYFITPVVGYHSSLKQKNTEIQDGSSSYRLDYGTVNDLQLGVVGGIKYKGVVAGIGVNFNQLSGNLTVEASTIKTNINQDISSREIIDRIDSTLIKTPVIRVPVGSDIVFQSGTPEYSLDTSFSTVYDTTTTSEDVVINTSSNMNYQLQYAYIPLFIGYEYPIKKCFVGGSFGLDLGVLVNARGEFFDNETNQVVSLSGSDFANKTTLAFNVGLTFGYYLKPNMALTVQPNLRQQTIAPLKNKDLPATRLGGLLGLRFEF